MHIILQASWNQAGLVKRVVIVQLFVHRPWQLLTLSYNL